MSHEFGNIDHWTKDKLAKVKDYLDSYLVALKNKSFRLEYIDAFAGTGYVTRKNQVRGDSLFEQDETVSLIDFIDGSARLALQTDPPFAQYTFIEKNNSRFKELSCLTRDFPNLTNRINLVHGDANQNIQAICSDDWIRSYRRGVMFLDPYGTQLSWATLEKIAQTQAIDTWMLFPIGTVNRLLNRNGRINAARRRRLDVLFGETSWFDKFYSERHDKLSFVSDQRLIKVASFEGIRDYFLGRLSSIFSEVAPNALFFKNSANSPIFMLCFAAGNPKGASTAVRIANHILGKR